jgi:hypothetical protein
VASEPGGELGVDAGAPGGSEAFVQSSLEHWTGLARAPTEHCEPGRRENREPESDPEGGRTDAGLVDRQRCRRDENDEDRERPVDQQADREAQAEGLDRRGRCPETAATTTAAISPVVTR